MPLSYRISCTLDGELIAIRTEVRRVGHRTSDLGGAILADYLGGGSGTSFQRLRQRFWARWIRPLRLRPGERIEISGQQLEDWCTEEAGAAAGWLTVGWQCPQSEGPTADVPLERRRRAP